MCYILKHNKNPYNQMWAHVPSHNKTSSLENTSMASKNNTFYSKSRNNIGQLNMDYYSNPQIITVGSTIILD